MVVHVAILEVACRAGGRGFASRRSRVFLAHSIECFKSELDRSR